jgi:chromosome segregation ATPase
MVIDDDTIKAIGLSLGTAVAAFFARRKLKMMASSDSVQMDEDAARSSVYRTLREENDRLRAIMEEKDLAIKELTDRADRAFKERNEAIIELAALRAEAKLLKEHTVRLETRISDMQRKIENPNQGS